jgi:uncharacterized protein
MTPHGVLYRPSMSSNPCRECGACCAVERVSFYRSEVVGFGGNVPAEWVEPARAKDHFVLQKRNNQCIGLDGTPGQRTGCRAYDSRPTVCREFMASWHNGEHNPYCDRARQQIGLPPLTSRGR